VVAGRSVDLVHDVGRLLTRPQLPFNRDVALGWCGAKSTVAGVWGRRLIMKVYLVDGTYELFRHFFGAPSHHNARGNEVAAVRGVLGSVLGMLTDGATHVGVATDHVIESFRNDLWPGYKTGLGIDPELWSQAWPMEVALVGLGVKVWPMVTVEADDALGSAAAVANDDPAVDQVLICTPDKDLGQCVQGNRVVQLDRRKSLVMDEEAIIAKFGVPPVSIPDYLALVGDSADGFPGLPGWGAKSAAAVLARWGHIEEIPENPSTWEVSVRGADKLAATLNANAEAARLFKHLATLRIDRSLLISVDELAWRGPTADFVAICAEIDAPSVATRALSLAEARSL
jgi:5'-3' exonuclease